MAARQPDGPPPAPTVQRLTIRYAKRGRMRFASHRDVARAIERAVRMAALPVGYSAGFSPHPRISYPGGAPTGAASEAEYLEISLTRECDPACVRKRLDAALPDGIDVIEVAEASGGSVATRLEASAWEVAWPGVSPGAAEAAVREFLGADSAEVERLTSKGLRRLDARAAVVRLEVGRRGDEATAAECVILRMIVRQTTPAVRPDDIMAALRQPQGQSSDLAPASPVKVTRLWQGPLDSLAAAEKGMILVTEAAGPVGFRTPPAADPRSAGQREELRTGKAMGLPASRANAAPAGPDRANEQLPREARAQHAGAQLADPRAREPEGRDFPHARDRATEWVTRSRTVGRG